MDALVTAALTKPMHKPPGPTGTHARAGESIPPIDLHPHVTAAGHFSFFLSSARRRPAGRCLSAAAALLLAHAPNRRPAISASDR